MTTNAAAPRISLAGSGALLLDVSVERFSVEVQRRIWAVGSAMRSAAGVREVVPGVNNLLVAFDALAVTPVQVRETLQMAWRHAVVGAVTGKLVEIPVTYGGVHREELGDWAAYCGLSVAEAVRRHSEATYSVAAVGAMPGFPYLSGLDPMLAQPRRASPRASIPEGAVIIGGAQAGVMPQSAPSGWHVLGRTTVKLFDPFANPPALLQPGDTVRFSILSIGE